MKKLIVLAMVIGLLISNICYAQSAKEAVRALQKLQVRTEVGISYRDYAPAVGDALLEVKLFLNSPEAKEKPELAVAISKVMQHYTYAGGWWQIKFAYMRLYGANTELGNTISINEGASREALNKYPHLRNVIKTIGLINRREVLWIDDILPIIWGAAKEDLDLAMNLFQEGK